MPTVKKKRLPPGLAKVRKELPPPAKVFRSKKRESRKRTRERLRREIAES
jgi:hypothetical protein